MSVYKSISRSSISGIYEKRDERFPTDQSSNISVTFNEWWNGEGIDFSLMRNNREDRFCLSIDEAQAVATILIAAGFIDVHTAEQEAAQMNKEEEMRTDNIKAIQADIDESCVQESYSFVRR